MTFSEERPFWERDEREMAELAQSVAGPLAIPDADLPGVEENLKVLLGHARTMAAALPPGALDAAPEPFAP